MVRLAVVVLLLGVLATLGGAWAARTAHENTEDELILQRAREAGAVIEASTPAVEAQLASAAAIAGIVDEGDAATIQRVLATQVGDGRRFDSASLWPVDGLRPIVVIGADPILARRAPDEVRAFFAQAVATDRLSVLSLLDEDVPHIGYAFTSPDRPARYLVYAEQALPADRTAVIQPDAAFAGLDYALYLDTVGRPEELLLASTSDLPLTGRRAAETIEFGDGSLRIVMSPVGVLGGPLLAAMPWLVLGAGAMLSVAAALLIGRLETRRVHAEALVAENERLHAAQRTAFLDLQQGLLPQSVPDIAGFEIRVRYVPGVVGTQVGGDWYDVIESNGQVVAMVGDVSGRGLPAATVMAAARYGVRALSAHHQSPQDILSALHALDTTDWDGHFATTLCGILDPPSATAVVANAGHPAPLLVTGGDARYIDLPVGPPIGVNAPAAYEARTVTIPPGSTLLMVTDGVFERRRESIDVGLERLRVAACADRESLDELLDGVLAELGVGTGTDDAAILAIRRMS